MNRRAHVTVMALWLLAGTALAYRPAGWTWYAWPYAYDLDSGDWHWFYTGDTQWSLGPLPGGDWRTMGESPLANGWAYHAWPYSYGWDSGAWFYLNEADTQACVNLTSGQWSRFGATEVPPGMAPIPGGNARIGNALSATGDGYADELPVQTVYVSAFNMDRHEVTKALWDEVRAWGLGNGYTDLPVGRGKALNHPVQGIDWNAMVKWCNARSQMEARPACYTMDGFVYKTGPGTPTCDWAATGYRLPTVAEWEKAARGGESGRRFPWSNNDLIQHAQANYIGTNAYRYDTGTTFGYHPAFALGGFPYTSPVGSFAPNGYDLYDMAGNVWEWCWDWSSSNGLAASPTVDPRGPTTGSDRVYRGGSWDYYADDCRVAGRYGDTPDGAEDDVGFRTVLNPAP